MVLKKDLHVRIDMNAQHCLENRIHLPYLLATGFLNYDNIRDGCPIKTLFTFAICFVPGFLNYDNIEIVVHSKPYSLRRKRRQLQHPTLFHHCQGRRSALQVSVVKCNHLARTRVRVIDLPSEHDAQVNNNGIRFGLFN